MEEEKRYKIYRTIMLIVLVVFITFILTSIVFYQYFVKGDSLNKYLTLMTSDESQDISQTLDTYKALIEKYYLGEVDEESLKEAQKLYIELIEDPDAKKYFEAETKFNILIADVNKIIGEAIQDVIKD